MNFLSLSRFRGWPVHALAVGLLCMSPVMVLAQGAIHLGGRESERLEVAVGKSLVAKSPEPVTRVSIANPEIADLMLLSPKEIYITGKRPGATNITLWQGRNVSGTYEVQVSYDIVALKQRLNDLFPQEKEISVTAADDSITLSGRVSSTAVLSRVVGLAESYVEKGKIHNFLEVSGVHQVMLEVRVSEMSRSLVNRLGINFSYFDLVHNDFGFAKIGELATLASRPSEANIATGELAFLVSPTVNALFRFHKGNAEWTGFIDALREEGLVKVLAAPTLVALSGQTAQFLVGGEYPIPVPQELGTYTVEYKEYGVRLCFTPTVLGQDKISINVSPEVSEPDFTTAVRVVGFVVPGLTTRRASTVVELADGQSFAIAGLLKDTVRDVASKYPFLGDIPVLGNLFKSRAFQKNETELIVIVTPRLVRPLDRERLSLPTDYYIEPNEIDFYVWGAMEGSGTPGTGDTRGELDGEFGHAIPLTP